MKTHPTRLNGGRFLLFSLAILLCRARTFSQSAESNHIPVVTIQATKPIASGPGNPGAFTVFRHGDTNASLNVFYDIGGTASNGVDYAQISQWVAIPAGATSNSILITPLGKDPSSNPKTVVLQLAPSPLLIPVNYEIGVPSNAVVYITGSNATNLPPEVRIINPANGTVFRAPVDVPILAYAHDLDDGVASVEFFAGSMSLGFGKPIAPTVTANNPDSGPTPAVYPTNIFSLVWSNPPADVYPLTAVAMDNSGLSATSAPIHIVILPPLPPPTNRPPIASIVATDPVAVEGTNCWVWRGETNVSPSWAAWPTAVCRYFTNCGPKAATFTIRRLGETNADLTVTYRIAGTASNGVDYVALPGFATIPAGKLRTLITVVPIDDGPPDVNKTVILALTSSTNAPPDYLIGYPPRAAVIIVDPPGPTPVASVLSDKCFRLSMPGPDAAWFCIERSTNLIDWTPVCTNQVVNGSIDFLDPEVPGAPTGFYRIVPFANDLTVLP